jgi:hypothetical protein
VGNGIMSLPHDKETGFDNLIERIQNKIFSSAEV